MSGDKIKKDQALNQETDQAVKNQALKKQEALKDLSTQQLLAKASNPICPKCNWPTKPVCRCIQLPPAPSKGGSGGGAAGGSGEVSNEPSLLVAAKIDAATIEKILSHVDQVNEKTSAVSPQLNQNDIEEFDSNFIAELLAKDELLIENDRENGCLTIKLAPIALLRLTPEEKEKVSQFIKFVENQLNKFQENNPQAICNKKIDAVDGKALAIVVQIRPPKFYDEFILKLMESINKLAIGHDKKVGQDKSINLIATLFQDKSKLSSDQKGKVKSDFLDALQHERKDLSVGKQEVTAHKKAHKITPLKIRPQPKGTKPLDQN